MKTKLYAKKTLSVFLAIMMLMSAWVWVAPTEAEAVAMTSEFNMSAYASIYNNTGSRGSASQVTVCSDGEEGNTTIVNIEFDISSLPETVEKATLNVNTTRNSGTAAESTVDFYLVAPTKSPAESGVYVINKIVEIYGQGNFVNEENGVGVNNAYNYFGVSKNQKLNSIEQTDTGAHNFDVTAAVNTARANGWEEFCLVFIMPKSYQDNNDSSWSDIHIQYSGTSLVCEYDAEGPSAATVRTTNSNAVSKFSDSSFDTGFTTVSGNFHGDNASTMASRGYYKNVLYSPHFPTSNNNLTNDYAGVYFGNLGNTADGARVWYPETTLIWDDSTTPQIPILFDIDSNSNNRVGVKNVYISSGANGLTFKDPYWTAKSECNRDDPYYTHFTFDWIMQENPGNYWISTSSGNDKESMCSSNGLWDIYGTYLQYTGGSFGSGSTYYKAITPTWVCRTGSNYTGTTNKTIYVIDYVPLKDALNNVKTLINEVKSNPAKYTTESVSALVTAADELIAAKPNNYINSSNNKVDAWNTDVSKALSDYNSAKNLVVQQYSIAFKFNDGTKHVYTANYGSSISFNSIAPANSITQITGDDTYHQGYRWDTAGLNLPTLTDNVTIKEVAGNKVGHSFGEISEITDAEHKWTCSVCDYVKSQAHVNGQGYETKDETCTEDGVMTYDCSICKKTAIATGVIDNIDGHSFTGDWTDKGDGTHYQKCIRCDAYGLAVDGVHTLNASKAHTWNNGTVTTPATCTTEGVKAYKCTQGDCGATKTEAIAKKGHENVTKTNSKSVANVCGGTGYDAFWTCADCGKIYKDEALTTEISAYVYTEVGGVKVPTELVNYGPAHEFTGDYAVASGGAEGKHYRKCKNFAQCGAYGPEEAHSYTSATTPSSCTAAGKTTYTCSVCNYSYSVALELAAHDTVKIDAAEPTCTEAGSNDYYQCSGCSKYFKDAAATQSTTVEAEKLTALGHTFASGNTDEQHPETDALVSAATCQSAATYRITCDICSAEKSGVNTTYTYGNPDTENGHKFNGTDIQKNENGTHSFKCTVEGCTEYGAAVSCSFEVTEEVASTCHTFGYTKEACSACGNEKTTDKTTYDFTNHDGAEEVRFAKEATCNTDGYTGDTYCLGCKAEKSKGTIIVANKTVHPHENMIPYEKVDSTCQKVGYEAYRYCSACGTYEAEKVEIPVKSHTFTSYVSNDDGTHTATCDTCAQGTEKATDKKPCSGGTANCVDKKVCEVCNDEYGTTDAANHKDVKDIDAIPATCQSAGKTAYKYCEACKTNVTEPKTIGTVAHSWSDWAKVENTDTHTRYCTSCDENAEGGIARETVDCDGGTATCIAAAICKDCGEAYGTVNAENHATKNSTLKDVVEATCQIKGFSGNYRYDCCNAVKTAGEEVATKAHKFSIETERKAATCTEPGSVTYKCSTCVESAGVVATDVQTLDIDAKNHASTETTTVNKREVTCESDGYTGDVYYVCCYNAENSAAENKKALKEKGTTVKANGQHVYEAAVSEYMIKEIKETVDENGKVTDREIVLKTTAPDYKGKVDARHEDDGKWYHVQLCSICNEVKYSACYTYKHTYNCVDTDICEVCKGLCSLTDEHKHDNIDTIEKVDATHTSNGVKEYYQCSDCDKFFLDDGGKKEFDPESEEGKALITISKDTVPCTSWEEKPYETVEPTCGKDGYKKYRCATEGCTKVKTVVIEATSDSHEWSSDYKVVKAPTCHSVGYEALYCTACGTQMPNTIVTIPATGDHDFDANGDGKVNRNDAVITPGESCKLPGKLTYTCQNEGCTEKLVEEDTQGVSSHKWQAEGEGWEVVGGDCASGVTYKRTCTVCGESEQKIENTNEHAFEIKKIVYPTAEADGYVIYYCVNCNYQTEPEILEFEGSLDEDEKHNINPNVYTVVKEATCENAEIREYICLGCGEAVRRYVGTPTEHKWVAQTSEIATCDRPGHSEYLRCFYCLAEKDKEIYPSKGHADNDGDGRCDNCNGVFYNGDSAEKVCSCMCHKTGIMGFFYKIIKIFWKIFGINKSCACGNVHF